MVQKFMETLFKREGLLYDEKEYWLEDIFTFEVKVSDKMAGTLAVYRSSGFEPENLDLVRDEARVTLIRSLIDCSKIIEPAFKRLAQNN